MSNFGHLSILRELYTLETYFFNQSDWKRSAHIFDFVRTSKSGAPVCCHFFLTKIFTFWLKAATRLILTANWIFRNKLIKSIPVDLFFRNKLVKICEIVESLRYFDKIRLIFVEGARGANTFHLKKRKIWRVEVWKRKNFTN